MRRLAASLAVVVLVACQRPPADPEIARQEATAARVTITRDDWGVPHVRGTSDADAVFGMIYAQAEDDFARIEQNYLVALGRLAEADGERAVWQDLRQRLFIHPDTLRAQYAAAPGWLQALMTAWADGLNHYLRTHPNVRPRVLTRFEPWMPLAFSEGSIGGDIESISLRELEIFYGGRTPPAPVLAGADLLPPEPSGSNGIAIAPSHTRDGKALLLINPHTSFFFREEVHMTSDSGLNAYGAATWGQFFIYQGFNATAGWMHTSSGADVIDEYLERVAPAGTGFTYAYGDSVRPVRADTVVLQVRTDTGLVARQFTTYHTHHGPVVRTQDGAWVTVRLMQAPVAALQQSYLRTKARNLAAFRATMELHTNSSNNTIFADAEGNIAYFHANHVPRRDPRFDWRRPVPGHDPATEWGPVHDIDDSPLAVNPPTGFVMNTNNWPYSAAGAASPRAADFAAYFDRFGENPRGVHALRLLNGRRDFTLESLQAAAYDPAMPAFETLVPPLLRAFDALPPGAPQRQRLAGPIAALRGWDARWDTASVATTLAVYWGEVFWRLARAAPGAENVSVYELMARDAAPAARLDALDSAVATLTADFGTWETPWGAVNRFQRLTGDIVQPFADSGASVAVGFPSSQWGTLASFGARTWPGTKKRYGTAGNSFVAVVEFGPRVRARAVTASGLQSVPGARHFNDQAARYAVGDLREVYFHPEQLTGHTERTYHPGR